MTAVLMGASVVVAYLDRVNISHAIVPIATELELSPLEKGALLASFGWGYVAVMVCGGLLVDRFSPRRVVTYAVIIWSAATALASIVTNLPWLIVTRILVGIGEAPLFPANARLVAEHFTEEQRGRATALFDVGSYVGAALAAPLVVLIMTTFGWRSAFLACAAVGGVWAIIWHATAPSRETQRLERAPSRSIGFPSIALDRKVIAASSGFFCYNYVKSVILSWFPLYLVTERNVDVKRLALIGMLPPVAAIISGLTAGVAMDHALRHGVEKTIVRKTCLGIAFVAGASILAVGVVPDQVSAIVLFMIAFGGIIAASPAIWSIPADIAPAPEQIGVISGIQNTVANLGTIVGPLATGAILQYTDDYDVAFAATATVSVLGAAAYILLMPKIGPIGARP